MVGLDDRPRYLRYLIASRRPEIVMIMHSELGYALLPYLCGTCPEPAYVDFTHVVEPIWRDGGYPRLAIAQAAHLDRHFASSQDLREWMLAHGGRADRIDVVHTNVDPAQWRRDPETRRRWRAAWQVDEHTPVLLFAGRLCAQKQPRVVGLALARLAARGRRFHAVIAGDGEERCQLEALVDAHGLSRRVTWMGALSIGKVRELMSGCDILLLPSRWEGIALSLFEAMACELAVVAAGVGGQRELVTPEVGVLVAPLGDEDVQAEAYARELESLVCDPERAHALGAAARRRVASRFPLDRAIDALLDGFGRARQHAGDRAAAAAPARSADEGAVAAGLASLREIPAAEERASEYLAWLRAHDALQRIESSRSWWLVEALHQRVLRLVGRGERSTTPTLESDDPRVRLERIRASRRYRLIRAAKRNPLYRAYARRRYGSDWEREALGPEALAESRVRRDRAFGDR